MRGVSQPVELDIMFTGADTRTYAVGFSAATVIDREQSALNDSPAVGRYVRLTIKGAFNPADVSLARIDR
jgi:polyisoprenoid-binding protein YceI